MKVKMTETRQGEWTSDLDLLSPFHSDWSGG